MRLDFSAQNVVEQVEMNMEEARATKKSVRISNRKKMAEKEEQWQVVNMCFGSVRKFLSESRKKKNNPVCLRRRVYMYE
jgi:hypothetical protein